MNVKLFLSLKQISLFTMTAYINVKHKEEIAQAKIDLEFYDKLSQSCWYWMKGYAFGEIDGKLMLLHRYIMNAPENSIVDHIDNNRLNCTKINLRLVTKSQNNQNKRKKPGCSSQFIGVSYNAMQHLRPWIASLCSRPIGYFADELSAAFAYDKAAHEKYGECARLNGVDEPINFVEYSKRPCTSNKVTRNIYLEEGTPFPFLLCFKKDHLKHTSRHLTLEEAQKNLVEQKSKLAEAKKLQVNVIIRNAEGIAIIRLNGKKGEGKEVFVDDDRFQEFSIFRWRYSEGYAMHNNNYMHRLVLKAKPGTIVDHINNNRLDNRKSNLRIVTASENNQNRSRRNNCKNKYMGVCREPKGLYTARIRWKGKRIHLGCYKEDIVAAWCYDQKVKELYPGGKINGVDKPSGWVFNGSRAVKESFSESINN